MKGAMRGSLVLEVEGRFFFWVALACFVDLAGFFGIDRFFWEGSIDGLERV